MWLRMTSSSGILDDTLLQGSPHRRPSSELEIMVYFMVLLSCGMGNNLELLCCLCPARGVIHRSVADRGSFICHRVHVCACILPSMEGKKFATPCRSCRVDFLMNKQYFVSVCSESVHSKIISLEKKDSLFYPSPPRLSCHFCQ